MGAAPAPGAASGENLPPEGICEDASGYFFKHRCVRRSSLRCPVCKKVVCDEHTYYLDGLPRCVPCSKKARDDRAAGKDDPLPGADGAPGKPGRHAGAGGDASAHDRHDRQDRTGHHDRWDFGPAYWYDGYGHYGSGAFRDSAYTHSVLGSGTRSGSGSHAAGAHDPHDLTEADGAALDPEKADPDDPFERSLGES